VRVGGRLFTFDASTARLSGVVGPFVRARVGMRGSLARLSCLEECGKAVWRCLVCDAHGSW